MNFSESFTQTVENRTTLILNRIKAIFENYGEQFEPTAVKTIQLCLYNFFEKKPEASEEEVSQIIEKMIRLSETESMYKNNENPIPPIGFELEIPTESFTNELKEVLDKLEIKNETVGGKNLREVNPSFSYSPNVQNRMLEELFKLGILPDLDKDTQKMQRTSGSILSLHLNFGMADNIDNYGADHFPTLNLLETEPYKEISILNTLITCAYTSPERLSSRKTEHTFGIKAAKPTEKDESEWSTGNNVRLELRTLEFRDYQTFRLLDESQKLVSMLLAYLKFENSLACKKVIIELKDLWLKFKDETEAFLTENLGYQYNTTLHNQYIDSLYSNDNRIIDELKKNPSDLKNNSRKLISKYASEVSKILMLHNIEI